MLELKKNYIDTLYKKYLGEGSPTLHIDTTHDNVLYTLHIFVRGCFVLFAETP